MRMTLTCGHSFANRTHLWFQIRIVKQNFFIWASSNTWMSHQALRYTPSPCTCAWRWQAAIVVQIQPTSRPEIIHNDKFLNYGKFECLGVWSGPRTHFKGLHVHVALTVCRSLVNWAHPEYKIVHKDKFFSFTTSSNVWVSHQASRYVTTDIAYTQH